MVKPAVVPVCVGENVTWLNPAGIAVLWWSIAVITPGVFFVNGGIDPVELTGVVVIAGVLGDEPGVELVPCFSSIVPATAPAATTTSTRMVSSARRPLVRDPPGRVPPAPPPVP